MNTKKLIAAIVLGLFTVPAFASAYTYSPSHYPRATETLVEGHTVFAVVQATICTDPDTDERIPCPGGSTTDFDISYDVRANVTLQRLGTAVAVLVRDRVKEVTPAPIPPNCATNRDIVVTILYENPGVLWFNDQFLVGDDLDIVETDVDANVDVCTKQSSIAFNPAYSWRYPCGGWVWSTQAGNPDPRTFGSWSYQESYRITDPNDKSWIIDKYSPLALGTGVVSVDQQLDLGLDDDDGSPYPYAYDSDDLYDGDLRAVVGGTNSMAAIQYYLGGFNLWTVPLQGTGTCMTTGAPDGFGPTSGQSSTPYTDTASHNPAYNFFYVDSDGAGPNHLEDVKYNAVLFYFFEDLVPKNVKIHGNGGQNDGDLSFCQAGTQEWDCGTGRNDDSEGNSHPYNDASADSGPIHVHPTASVDLYYHNVAPPGTGPKNYAVYDLVGSAAPKHAHPAGEVFDDRVRTSACADADWHDTEQSYTYNGGGTWSGSYSQTSEEAAGFGNGNPASPHGPWTPNDGECRPDGHADGYGYDGGYTGKPGEYY